MSTTSPMPKRTAGTPPEIALGTMNFGKRTSAKESERIVRVALERGVRVFDTANYYNAGESERILGRALGRDRERALVATKVGLDRIAHQPEGLSRGAILRALPASLERLGTDRVDLYYLHAPDGTTPLQETLDAMDEIVRSGRALHWGASNYAAWEILEMNIRADSHGYSRPIASQVLYNALHRQLDVEYFAFARRHPIHTTVYNPLAGGLLTGKHRRSEGPTKGSRFDENAMYQRRYWTPTMFERVEQLRALATEAGWSLLELAYAWVASRSDVDSMLVGPADVAQLEQAFDAISRTLSPELLARVDDLSRQWSGTDTAYVR
ncbi:MAG: aldo/keto reductase [Myxococcota bacterium]|nr:aldo/keto reductase [Myxococcota bacterium]